MVDVYNPSHEVGNLHVDTGTCNLIVLHSMECPMVAGRAVSWGQYLHVKPWPFFAQDYYDPANHVRVAPLDTKVAHCGNGNQYGGHRSIGREHAGYAGQPRALWLSKEGIAELDPSAQDTAVDVAKWKIPVAFLTPDDLRAGRRGITSHNNCSIALHGSSHTDPGDNFPYDRYLELVNGHLGRGPVYRPETAHADLHTDQEEEEDMQVMFMREKSHAEVYIVAGDGTRTHVQRLPDQVTVLTALGSTIVAPPAGAKVETIDGVAVWVVSDGVLTG